MIAFAHSSASRATIHAGARHTTKSAAQPLRHGVFSRPESMVSGLGVPIRKAGSATDFACLYPAPPDDLDSRTVGFKFNQELETMTAINTPKTGILPTLDAIQLHAQAINASRMVAHYLSQPDSNLPGAQRQAVKALHAISKLRIAGSGQQAANDSTGV